VPEPAATNGVGRQQTEALQEEKTMSIKRILAPLPGSVTHAGEIDIALAAAKALSAHVEALFIIQPPPTTYSTTTRGRMGMGDGGYWAREAVAMQANHFTEERIRFAEEQGRIAREAREKFAHACAARDIPIVATSDEHRPLPSASWSEAEGLYLDITVRRAAAFDMIVAASAAVTESLKDIAEQSLLQTRRPVLLAPSRMENNLGNTTMMIAWDESPECWHAVSAAIPFLQLAKSVQVISVDRDARRRSASQAEILAYLRCHSIGATARVIAPHLRSVGDTLLAAAEEEDVGLLVMGAYSHSRLREMLLGGATRHILKNAIARPVLLAH
jgi:nucleotide-binding universal stress UspA family protein